MITGGRRPNVAPSVCRGLRVQVATRLLWYIFISPTILHETSRSPIDLKMELVTPGHARRDS